MEKSKLKLLVGVLGLGLILSACGAPAPTESAAPPSAATSAAPATAPAAAPAAGTPQKGGFDHRGVSR